MTANGWWLVRVWRRLLGDEGGQDLVEYALLLSLFGLACLAAWDLIRNGVGASYTGTKTGIQGLWDPPPPGSASP
jgi:Flp pilus assembly pilin Flp